MANVRGALVVSILERYLLLIIAFGSNIVLARVLLPEQIGVYSVSMALLGVAQAFRDFGAGSYLIQEKELSRGKIRTVFGLSLVLGFFLFLVVIVAAPLIADFYGKKQMTVTLRIAALNFLLLPFCTVSLSLLRREMHFRAILYISLIAAALGAALSIGLALFDFGENSLAIGAVATNAVTGLGAWIARGKGRMMLPSLSEWRSVMKFGGQSSLAGVVTTVSMNANDLIVGRLFGFEAVAFLSRAQGLMNLFHRDLMGAVRNVALPAFAAAHRSGSDLGQPFLRSVALVAVFAWPFYGLLSIYSIEILDLLFGAQWLSSAGLVPIFALAGAIAAWNALTPNLLVAVGRMDLLLKVELLMQPLRVLLIFIAAVVFQTLEACALAYLLSAAITLPVMWSYKRRCVADDGPLLRRYVLSTLAVALVAITPALLHVSANDWFRTEALPVWQWLPISAFGLLLGVLAARALSHPFSTEPVFQALEKRAKAILR